MTIERFPIVDRMSWLALRKDDVTASVMAALFGVHPYMTAAKLWAIKSGSVSEDETETPAMRRGRLLEPIALTLLREERPDWTIDAGKVYLRDPDARIGATPDAFATSTSSSALNDGLGIVQIKTVGHFAFKKGWRDENGEVQVPLWIAVQANVEASLTGASWAVVAAMSLGDGGLEMHVEDIPIKPALMEQMRLRVADFWRRVEENDPYPFDFTRDSELIARLYSDDDGGEIDLSGNERIANLVNTRAHLKACESAGSLAAKERKPLDAEIIAMLGNATRGRLADGRVVEAPTTRRKGFVVEPTSYRAVKVRG